MSANPLYGIEGIKELSQQIQGIGIPKTILNNTIPTPDIEKTSRIEFKELLNMALNALNNTQVKADNLIKEFAAGKDVDLHNVMLAMEKAYLTLNLALQVKNKIADAYQEIMRMQI